MKIKSLLFLMVLSLGVFSSCRQDESGPDLTKTIVGTYHGHLETATAAVNASKVIVTKLADDKVKISPESNIGTTFEITIKAGERQYYSGSADGFSVRFNFIGGIRALDYERSGEFFTGQK